MNIFSDRFRNLADRKGVTHKDLAAALNLKPPTLSNYMNGREAPYDLLVKISEYFDVTVDYLVGKTEFYNYEAEARSKELENFSQQNKSFTDIFKKYNSLLQIFYYMLEAIETFDEKKKEEATEILLLLVNSLSGIFSGLSLTQDDLNKFKELGESPIQYLTEGIAEHYDSISQCFSDIQALANHKIIEKITDYVRGNKMDSETFSTMLQGFVLLNNSSARDKNKQIISSKKQMQDFIEQISNLGINID